MYCCFFVILFCNHRRSQCGNGTMSREFLVYLVILCFERQCPEQITAARIKVKVFGPPQSFGLATLLLVTTFIKRACTFLAHNHVPQYQNFQTALSWLMFILPLTESSQQPKTARDRRSPMKSRILIIILRRKQYYRLVTVLIRV